VSGNLKNLFPFEFDKHQRARLHRVQRSVPPINRAANDSQADWGRANRERAMKGILATASALTLLVAAAAMQQPANAATAIALVRIDVAIVAQGYRASELIGHAVTNDKNEDIGKIDDLMIGRDTRALVAILQVGGFLGIGGHLVAIPYKSLVFKDAQNKIILPGATKEALSSLNEFKYAH
jgi:sporulation protein YlmC with PRC-barrel domain